jgi:tetrahydromethanopterin S-methyltransferase subunit A
MILWQLGFRAYLRAWCGATAIPWLNHLSFGGNGVRSKIVSGGPNSAISLTGAGSTYNGSLITDGSATITGSQTTLNCGVIAKTIAVTGARLIAKSC